MDPTPTRPDAVQRYHDSVWPFLLPNEVLYGFFVGVWKPHFGSVKPVVVGVTSWRILLVKLDRRGRPTEAPISIRPEEIVKWRGNLTSVSSASAAITGHVAGAVIGGLLDAEGGDSHGYAQVTIWTAEAKYEITPGLATKATGNLQRVGPGRLQDFLMTRTSCGPPPGRSRRT